MWIYKSETKLDDVKNSLQKTAQKADGKDK